MQTRLTGSRRLPQTLPTPRSPRLPRRSTNSAPMLTSQQPLDESQLPAGVDSWIRAFDVQLLKRLSYHQRALPVESGAWEVIAPPEHPLADDLRRELRWPTWRRRRCLFDRASVTREIVGLLLASARQSCTDRQSQVRHGPTWPWRGSFCPHASFGIPERYYLCCERSGVSSSSHAVGRCRSFSGAGIRGGLLRC